MAAHFVAGWTAAAEFMATLGGGVCAVCLGIAALVLLLSVAGAIFDAATKALARRWKKKGRRPAGRWVEIIARSDK